MVTEVVFPRRGLKGPLAKRYILTWQGEGNPMLFIEVFLGQCFRSGGGDCWDGDGGWHRLVSSLPFVGGLVTEGPPGTIGVCFPVSFFRA